MTVFAPCAHQDSLAVQALEVVPYTLAQNAGLNALLTVTELRNRHAGGDQCAGINVRRGTITDILEENVVQPLLVSTSAFTLATECVCMILKIVRLRLPIRASVCFAKVVS
eukprot:COSAG02_NODE_4470_length_5330_cov_25.203785_2_plen_111_part_00